MRTAVEEVEDDEGDDESVCSWCGFNDSTPYSMAAKAVRAKADRGRLLLTLSPDVVKALEEIADELDAEA